MRDWKEVHEVMGKEEREELLHTQVGGGAQSLSVWLAWLAGLEVWHVVTCACFDSRFWVAAWLGLGSCGFPSLLFVNC